MEEASDTSGSGDLLIRCGRLIDGRTDVIQEDIWVLIYDGRFKKIKKDLYARRGTPVFDLRGQTCLPWQSEMHTYGLESPESRAGSGIGEERAPAEFIEPGLYGDLIAVKGNPLQDSSALEQVEAVVKGGLVFKAPDGATR